MNCLSPCSTRDTWRPLARSERSSAASRTWTKRLQAVRDWYVSQEQQRPWIILETEFNLRALRNRAVKKRLAELWRQELETYTALVAQHFSELGRPAIGRPGAIALSLMAIVHGLGRLSLIDTDRDARARFAEARSLVFNRLM